MEKKARLESISRGFGGDTATYLCGSEKIIVSISWALLCPFCTKVFVDGTEVASFDDARYVQPVEALERCGYAVSGSVDFAY